MDHSDGDGYDPQVDVDRKKGMNSSSLSVIGHVTSFVSFLFVTANLVLWLPLLLLACIVRYVIPLGAVEKAASKIIESVYRSAVNIDTWWIFNVLGIELDIEDHMDVLGSLSRAERPVIICNHQSWFDIFLLQTLISRRGPILKFVIKVELLWVPVLGWICLALNFPRLRRKPDTRSRAMDRSNVKKASITLGKEPGALLIFPEGTRFSEEKRIASDSSHSHLLLPRPGGLSVIQRSIPEDTRFLDISIRYYRGEANCWRCMSSTVDKIHVKIDSFQAGDSQDAADCLNQCWSLKDTWLAQK